MATLALPFLIIFDVIFFSWLFMLIFGGLDGFLQSIGYWFTPDWLSFFRGEWEQDRQAEFGIVIFGLIVWGVVYMEQGFLEQVRNAPKPTPAVTQTAAPPKAPPPPAVTRTAAHPKHPKPALHHR